MRLLEKLGEGAFGMVCILALMYTYVNKQSCNQLGDVDLILNDISKWSIQETLLSLKKFNVHIFFPLLV